MKRIAISGLIAVAETVLLSAYLFVLPLSVAWAGTAAGVVVSVVSLGLACYLPSRVLAASGEAQSDATRLSRKVIGPAAALGLAIGASGGIWVAFRVLARTDSVLVGDMLVIAIALGTALLGSFLATLMTLPRRVV